MTELHVLTSTKDYAKVLEGRVKGREVLELGVGTGVLTQLLLDAGARAVLGYEIVPDLVYQLQERIRDPRMSLRVADYTVIDLDWIKEHPGLCLVSNPAYSTLPFIVKEILPVIKSAILMVPSRCVEEFKGLGFQEVVLFEPTEFEPIAAGLHHLMLRGFGVKAPARDRSHYFVDLARTVEQLNTDTIPERIEELSNNLPSVGICALGGFPILAAGMGHRWCGELATEETIQRHILTALGLSAVLTYVNKRKHSLDALGRICVDRNETWAYHWMTATLVFARHSPAVHLAFAHDSRFKMGWAVEKEYTGKLFGVWTASASLKDWLKFTSKWDDTSFDAPTRQAMTEAYDLLKGILP